MTEHEVVGWHHQLNGHGFGWTLGVSDGQGGLVCCGSWGRKESDMTERLNSTELNRQKISTSGFPHFILSYISPFFEAVLRNAMLIFFFPVCVFSVSQTQSEVIWR